MVSCAANYRQDRTLIHRLVAAPGVLEDPKFEVQNLEIHTVKVRNIFVRAAC